MAACCGNSIFTCLKLGSSEGTSLLFTFSIEIGGKDKFQFINNFMLQHVFSWKLLSHVQLQSVFIPLAA